VILHADLDAFYASVAQRDDPSLRGKPLVVAWASRRSVVLTASYEARPFGIRSAMPLYRARLACPELIVVNPDFDKYVGASKAVVEILRSHSHAVQRMSLDEAFLDLGDVAIDEAAAIARKIKDEVMAATSLRISIGAASGKMVAKIASDEGKPDGLVCVPPGTEAAFLADKPVGRLWGVGPKTQVRLKEKGIERIEQIASMGEAQLFELFGRWGKEVRDLALGIDPRRVHEDHEGARSISTEQTFEYDVTDLAVLAQTVRQQAGELAERLAHHKLRACTVGVKVKRADFRVFGKQTTLAQPADDARVISAAALHCLKRAFDGKPVRLIGVRVASIEEGGVRQTSLFQVGPTEVRRAT
jgi:DNA polymerase-4